MDQVEKSESDKAMKKLWSVRPQNPELAAGLAREFSLTLPVAQILIHRGLVESSAISLFLEPRLKSLRDPFLLAGMDTAVNRVLLALSRQEKIIVFGDYDVDGISSVALLLEILGKMGGKCGYYLPSRFTEGYGLKMESVRRCVEEGAKLIVCADCGTNSRQEISWARSQVVDFVVLDHHAPDGGTLEALATVNPKRVDSIYREELASVGIAFKLAHGLVKRCRERGAEREDPGHIDVKGILDFVALGTIADMVPLTGENRIFVKAGLGVLDRSPHPGLKILRDLACGTGTLSATDVSYRITPRLNANGRLSDAQDALALLCTDSETQAMVLAQRLEQENQRRRQIERQVTEEAVAMVRQHSEYLKDPILVLFQPQWHFGVVGIVASRLVREFGKPSVVIGVQDGVGKGSARSIDGFHITEALAQVKSELIASGGHANAAGCTIDLNRIKTFRSSLNEYAKQILGDRTLDCALQLDMELAKDELCSEFIEQLGCLEPFGMGNPRPLFSTSRISIEGYPRIVGGSHLKFQTRVRETTFDVMGFQMVSSADHEQVASLAGRKIDIAYHPGINVFQGQRRLQLNLEDYRLSK